MDSSQIVLTNDKKRDIHTIAQYIEKHINENWDTVFQDSRSELLDLYDKIGDSAYGMYGKRLFQPIHEQLKQAGLRTVPKLPFGGFSSSREWGPEEERQRWFWSKVATVEGAPIGSIAFVFFHDHFEVRIPRPPEVIAVEETTKGAIIEALSRLSDEFKNALEAKEEYAQYMAQTP